MILLFPILWLILWVAISVITCAVMGLPPARALHTGGLIFLLGSFGLPLIVWMGWRVAGRLLRLQNLRRRR
ncbi:MAG TPA: hypothetical protein VFL15_11500 [Gammaproteobacteria bacterium]|nr:hypothetical protein [Gammaproteobacteria bacterium]